MSIDTLNWTGYIYGGLAHSAHMQYDEHSEESGEGSVRRGIRRMGLDEADLVGRRVLEVGSGWYGLGFCRLGALVEHHNLSTRTVSALNAYARKHGYDNLRCFETDLVNDELPERHFDIVYLSGVFQHLSCPAKALVNISRALKPGGLAYIDVYRSGRWRWFVVSTLRRIVRKALLHDVLACFTDLCALGNRRSFSLRQVELLIDDLFVEYIHWFHPEDVIADAASAGLEPLGPATSMELADLGQPVDHSSFYAHVFNTLIFRRNRDALQVPALARTTHGRDQLADIFGAGGSYQAVGDLTGEFLLAHKGGKFSRGETVSQLVSLYRMAHPCLPEDPYFVVGRREPGGSCTVASSPETLAARHSAWCSFLANTLSVESPLPQFAVPSLGYELKRFLAQQHAASQA
ncbi:MAG: hypothetical protein JWO48_2636 [Bryobacterales bacterium]|nr:hypothetical protein [Bryobacterales bacterium]